MKAIHSTPDSKTRTDSLPSTGLWQDQSSYMTTESHEHPHLHTEAFNENFHMCDLRIDTTSQRNLAGRVKKGERLRRRKILREVLGRIVLGRFWGVRDGVNKIMGLPERRGRAKGEGKRERLHEIAEQLVFKAPITAETAFLRSIINLRKSKINLQTTNPQNKIQNPHKNTLSTPSHSLTIYPCEQTQSKTLQKSAILLLQHFSKSRIKKILHSFHKNALTSHTLKNYYKKIINNFRQNQLYFLRKLRVMTKMHRESVMGVKRKSLEAGLMGCLRRRDKIVVESLKGCWQGALLRRMLGLELIGRSEQYQKLSAFFAIYRFAAKRELRNPEESGIEGHEIKRMGQLYRFPENSRIKSLRKHIESLRKPSN